MALVHDAYTCAVQPKMGLQKNCSFNIDYDYMLLLGISQYKHPISSQPV